MSPRSLTCTKGCAACCTEQVTATEAEAALILVNLQEGRSLPPRLAGEGREKPPNLLTTNEFAMACLEGREVIHPNLHKFPVKCIFLDSLQACSIYPLRPLMCRLFISRNPCGASGEAMVPDHILTFNILLQQLAEHLYAGRRWGNLVHLLHFLSSEGENEAEGLRKCSRIPGFLVTPAEREYIETHLLTLWRMEKNGRGMEDYLEEKFGHLFGASSGN